MRSLDEYIYDLMDLVGRIDKLYTDSSPVFFSFGKKIRVRTLDYIKILGGISGCTKMMQQLPKENSGGIDISSEYLNKFVVECTTAMPTQEYDPLSSETFIIEKDKILYLGSKLISLIDSMRENIPEEVKCIPIIVPQDEFEHYELMRSTRWR